MKKTIRIILPLLVTILSISYATGDYFGWWDNLSSRSIAMKGLNRLSSLKGYPTIIISNNEEEFNDLLHIIILNTNNKEAVAYYHKGIIPSAIVRMGGNIKARCRR